MGLGGELLDPYLRRARRCTRRHFSDHRSIVDLAGMGDRERQELDRDLYHSWPWRPFFGLAPILENFPTARAVAVPDVVKAMEAQLLPDPSMAFGASVSPAEYPSDCWWPSRSVTMSWSWRTQARPRQHGADRHGLLYKPACASHRPDRCRRRRLQRYSPLSRRDNRAEPDLMDRRP